MARAGRVAVALAPIIAMVAACSAPGDKVETTNREADPSAGARADLGAPVVSLEPLAGVEGNWVLTLLDGRALSPEDGPAGTLTITRRQVIASSGCNRGVGPALVVGDRLMMPSVMATEAACGPEGMMAREAALFGTLQDMPRLDLVDGGATLVVTGSAHGLRFGRREQAVPQGGTPDHATTLGGRTVTVSRVDAAGAKAYDSGILMRFASDAVTLEAPGCAPARGEWRAEGDRLRLTLDDAAPCAGDFGVRALIAGNSDLRWLVDVNGEVILATRDHLIAGRATPRR